MRIGLVNEFFPPFAPGGAEWSMNDLTKGLAEKGHKVFVITPNYGAPAYESKDGIQIYRFPFPKKMKQGRKMPGFMWHANFIYYLYSAWSIYKIAKLKKIQILHAQNKYSLPGSWLAARFLRIPILSTVRDTSNICRIAVCLHHHNEVPADCSLRKLLSECSEEYYQNYYDRKSLWRHAKDKIFQIYHWFDVHLRRFLLNRTNAVVGVSRGILEVHERSRIFAKSKADRHSIYNFVHSTPETDPGKLSALSKKYGIKSGKTVLYVGGFSRGKGTDDFVKAFQVLHRKIHDLNAVMIGSGHIQEAVDNITILNQVPREDLSYFYQMAAVVVVPSICQESLSRVLLEAAIAGKPLIGTKVGGTPEAIIDGENGFLVERKDPQALAGAIEKIVTDDNLAKRFGKKSRELVLTKFEKSAVISQYEQVYKQCIEKNGGRIF